MKALVTGGAGFIGTHLCLELAKRGNEVTALDNLSTGKQDNVTILDKAGVKFNYGSILDLGVLAWLFEGKDVVFHLAALPSAPRSVERPLEAHNANNTGTLNVLLMARDYGVKKVVYASSSSVYGDNLTLPKTEDMIPKPMTPYAVSKLCGEHYCGVFTNLYGLETVCLRYFNVYGMGQNSKSIYSAVIPRFLSKVSTGYPPMIYGDGEQSRDFTYVGDAVEATILAAQEGVVGVYNVGSGRRVTINGLADMTIKLLGKDGLAPIYEDERQGDVRHSLADISLIKEVVGYEPKYTLEQGLKEIVKEAKCAKS